MQKHWYKILYILEENEQKIESWRICRWMRNYFSDFQLLSEQVDLLIIVIKIDVILFLDVLYFFCSHQQTQETVNLEDFLTVFTLILKKFLFWLFFFIQLLILIFCLPSTYIHTYFIFKCTNCGWNLSMGTFWDVSW